MNRQLILWVLALSLLSRSAPAAEPDQARRPNVVIILVDDKDPDPG